jgi:hypothetical protein
MSVAVAIVILVAGLAAAYSYRCLPRWFHALTLHRAQYSPAYKKALLAKLRSDLDSYQAVLKDIPTYHTRALHLFYQAMLAGIMTLLMVALLILSQVVQMRRPDIDPVHSAVVDVLLVLFALTSLVGLRFAAARFWMFVEPQRNMGRMRGMIARLQTSP